MMTPWERRRLARKVAERFDREEFEQMVRARFCPIEIEDAQPVPLALKFDLALTEADRIRLHAWGVGVGGDR